MQPMVSSTAADTRLLSASYTAGPGPNDRANMKIVAALVATACVAATTYWVSLPADAATDAFALTSSSSSSVAMRASRQSPKKAAKSITGIVGAAAAGPARAADTPDFSDFFSSDIEYKTDRADMGKLKKDGVDPFQEFLKGKQPDQPVELKPKVELKIDENDPFASFAKKPAPKVEAPKADVFKAAKPEPKVDVPKPEAEPKADADPFAMFKKAPQAEAPKAPEVQAPKVQAEAPKPEVKAPEVQAEKVAEVVKKKTPKFEIPKPAEVPKPEPPKEAPAKPEDLFADFLKKDAEPEKVTEGSQKVVELTKKKIEVDESDPFALFKKAPAAEKPPVKVPEVKAPEVKAPEVKVPEPKAPDADPFAAFKKGPEVKPPVAEKVPEVVKKTPKFEVPKPAEVPKPEIPKEAPPKPEDLFADFLKKDIEPEKISDASKTVAGLKKVPVDQADPFAALKSAAPEAAKVAPKVPAPKVPEGLPKVEDLPPAPKGFDFHVITDLLSPTNLAISLVALGGAAIAALLMRGTPSKRKDAKAAVLATIEGTNKGFNVSDDEEVAIESAVKALEKLNPTKDPLDSTLIDGRWEVLYSRNPILMGKGGASKPKATFVTIDVDDGLLKIEQVVSPLPFVTYTDTTTTLLDAETSSQATLMKGNPRTVKLMKEAKSVRGTMRGARGAATEAGASVPISAAGSIIRITYLDDTWRVSRGDEGEISIFRREGAEEEEVPVQEPEEEDIEQPAVSTRGYAPPSYGAVDEEEVEEVVKPKWTPPSFGRSQADDEAEDAEEGAPAFAAPKFSLPSFGAPKPAEVEEEEEEEEAYVPAEEEAEDEAEAAAPAFTNPLSSFKLPEMPAMPELPDFQGIVDKIQKGPEGLKELATGTSAPKKPSDPVSYAADAKDALLSAVADTDRGADVTEAQAMEIGAAIETLEGLNPTPAPLASPLISGKWELLYTTSESILGKDKPEPLRPKGPIYQYIDTAALRANNEQTVMPIDDAPFLKWKTTVSANLELESDSVVAVQFEKFGIGPIKVDAPASANAKLETTYLDETLRISRGSKGNVFVLKMVDRTETQPN
eukprot:CAMPEP_0174300200 /NCGR_PEP_ID=MMETSP0809-20121228/58328_1 /TAXON_ID=73025 ORGANISM="Eutreptiella gymnastica-like, Strain CCMP1594" /NCGR_SAMPLE_ID=MMETSP0809 /ASSEMBLY_ACC=CAM_ASM_000658 /LENGTH=1067 /DNA_ID=CAMNT_0015405747 /DNA_START=33 /DNA_END=3236 /DNA_ORIENTATION=+